eukprot:Selendium_serpulae@DN4830_c0_g1_i1.p2
MGNVQSVMHCFERWGRRGPDGALIKNYSDRSSTTSTTASSGIYSGPSTPQHDLGFTGGTPHPEPAQPTRRRSSGGGTGSTQEAERRGIATARTARTARRRPSIAVATKSSPTTNTVKESSSDDDDDSEDDGAMTLADKMTERIKKLRTGLNVEARIKTAFSTTKVMMTIDEHGEHLQWYQTEHEDKKVRNAKISEINKVQITQADAQTVEVFSGNPPEMHSFYFKSARQATEWINNLESLRTIKAMA